MRRASAKESDMRRLAEAAAWRIRLSEADTQTCAGFEAWLAVDAANRRAWQSVGAPWDLLGELSTTPELLQLRREVLGRARNVGYRRWRPHRPARFAAMGVAILALLAIVLPAWQWWARPDIYRTNLGERRVVTLIDGSRISLDSGSEIRVNYTMRTRDLWLETGQARFDVAHDPARPFSVTSGNQKVLATGTVFNIDMKGTGVLVTLIEGRIVVIDQSIESRERLGAPASSETHTHQIELHAGQQLITSPSGQPTVENVDLARVTAWQTGRLVFENDTLATVVERFSRYTRRPILIEDEPAAQLRISGVFNTADIDGFVETISRYLPVHVESGEKGALLIQSNR